jgi:hypothetical protein
MIADRRWRQTRRAFVAAPARCIWTVEDGPIAFTGCTLDGQPLADGTVGPG